MIGKFVTALRQHVNIKNVVRLFLMPCLYGWFKDCDCDLVLGIVLGMILMLVVQDVK